MKYEVTIEKHWSNKTYNVELGETNFLKYQPFLKRLIKILFN